ncbi:MAG: hypothetical protein ABH879_01225 [archaeon]
MKKGRAEIIGGFILLGLVIVGGFSSYKIISENRYVGDRINYLYYDLKNCDAKEIPADNRINFKSMDEAHKNGYLPATCSKK